MNLSNTAKHWLKNKPSSYINKNLDLRRLERFDMGECIVHASPDASYPNPNAIELKKTIAKTHNITTSMITVASGADELIETLPRIFVNPGDCVVVIAPTFFRFIDSSLRVGAKIVLIKTVREDGFVINEKIINQVIKKAKKHHAKLIWLCSPNNPTGVEIKHSLIEKVVKKTKAFVVIDQVFNGLTNYMESNNKKLITENNNVLLLRSFSKVHGLAGLRIGFGLGNKKTIRLLEKWRLPFNVSTHSQRKAIKTLRNTKQFRNTKLTIDKERIWLFKEIKKLSNLEIGGKSNINIFLLRHKTKDIFKELLRKNILVAELRNSPGLEQMSFVRITIQKRKQNLLLLNALKEIS